jgi:hypothetical protein
LLCLLAGLGVLLGLFVAELAVVHDLADRRPLHGRNFDQIQASLTCLFESLSRGNNTKLLALGANEPNWTYANLLVNAIAAVAVAINWGWGDTDTSFALCPLVS